jgi:hypothetical protein
MYIYAAVFHRCCRPKSSDAGPQLAFLAPAPSVDESTTNFQIARWKKQETKKRQLGLPWGRWIHQNLSDIKNIQELAGK